jgi:hypothetical protein
MSDETKPCAECGRPGTVYDWGTRYCEECHEATLEPQDKTRPEDQGMELFSYEMTFDEDDDVDTTSLEIDVDNTGAVRFEWYVSRQDYGPGYTEIMMTDFLSLVKRYKTRIHELAAEAVVRLFDALREQDNIWEPCETISQYILAHGRKADVFPLCDVNFILLEKDGINERGLYLIAHHTLMGPTIVMEQIGDTSVWRVKSISGELK